MRRMLLGWVYVAMVACGDNEIANTPLPQAVDAGGPVLASPFWAAITFPDDPVAADIAAFLGKLGRSTYWTDVMREYGVGQGSLTVVHATAPAPDSDPTVKDFLAAHLKPLAPGWPAPEDDIVYVLYTPASSAFDCNSLAGYHSELQVDGRDIPYVVVPRCSYGLDPLEELAQVTTHELVEAATDPLWSRAPAYLNASNAAWQTYDNGGELADLCQRVPSAAYIDPELGHRVQRVWSNVEAAAGHDPCVPHPAGGTYFQAAPLALEPLVLTIRNTAVATPGLHIPIGTSRTVEIKLLADGETPPIAVSAQRFPGETVGGLPDDVVLSWDRTTGDAGETLHLSIGIAADSAGAGHEYVVITSQVGDVQHTWPVAIAN